MIAARIPATALDPRKRCDHCGMVCGDYEGGYARIGDAVVCHPNVPWRVDCYRMITVWGETLGDRKKAGR